MHQWVYGYMSKFYLANNQLIGGEGGQSIKYLQPYNQLSSISSLSPWLMFTFRSCIGLLFIVVLLLFIVVLYLVVYCCMGKIRWVIYMSKLRWASKTGLLPYLVVYCCIEMSKFTLLQHLVIYCCIEIQVSFAPTSCCLLLYE